MDHFIQLTILVLWTKQFFVVCMDLKLLVSLWQYTLSAPWKTENQQIPENRESLMQNPDLNYVTI